MAKNAALDQAPGDEPIRPNPYVQPSKNKGGGKVSPATLASVKASGLVTEAPDQARPAPAGTFREAIAAAILAGTEDHLAGALVLARNGIPVFPVDPKEKVPIPPRDKDEDGNPITGTGGHYKATCDEEQIRRWWKRHPDRLIGIPMGERTGIWALDIDSSEDHDDGLKAWLELAAEHPEIITREHRSATGGLHLTFIWNAEAPIACGSGKLPAGIHVKGMGGYIVVPPSKRKGRFYTVARDIDPVEPPAWLVDLILDGRQEGAAPNEELASDDPAKVAYAASQTRNNLRGWPEWKRYVMAIRNAVNGDEAMLSDIVHEFSSRWTEGEYDAAFTDKCIEEVCGCPPHRIGVATVYYMADKSSPNWRADYDVKVMEDFRHARQNAKSEPKKDEPKDKPLLIEDDDDDEEEKVRRPIIKVVGGQISYVTDYAEHALLAVNEVAPIMSRARHLVQPIISKLPASKGRTTEVTLLQPLQVSNVIYLLNKYGAIFKRFDARSKKWVKIDPPEKIAKMMLEKGSWEFPAVVGVITTPTLRPDGSVLDQPGYDEDTKIWLASDSNLIMPAMPERPTRKDAEQALKLFENLLRNFPFVAKVDQAVALAAILTSVLRGAFDVAPMFLFLAFEVGSGKSFLADVISTITRGQVCPVITNVNSKEEMEKRLGSLILEGVPIISLDNCSHNLGGDLLCQISERKIVCVRILGKSKTPECEWRGIILGNGNNITFLSDMTRRGLIVNLDPKVERPELREFDFNPIERVMADRGAYIAAALTIARAYITAGSPKVCGPIGSYEEWSAFVRAPLIWLGKEDPVKSMEIAREADPIRAAVRNLIGFWIETLKHNVGYSASDLIKHVDQRRGGDDLYPEFRELLLQQAGTPRGDVDVFKLGRWLQAIRGQIHHGHRLDLVKKSGKHGNRFALKKI